MKLQELDERELPVDSHAGFGQRFAALMIISTAKSILIAFRFTDKP